MRKLVGVSLFVGLMLLSTVGLAEPKAEIFGGYQYTRFDGGFYSNGLNAALTGNYSSVLGIRADFSSVYRSGSSFQTYTFGPEVSLRLPAIKPFAHALFGGARASGGGVSSNGFDMMYGGGVDLGSGRLAFRAAQLDWMITRANGFTDKNNIRYSTGLVIRF